MWFLHKLIPYPTLLPSGMLIWREHWDRAWPYSSVLLCSGAIFLNHSHVISDGSLCTWQRVSCCRAAALSSVTFQCSLELGYHTTKHYLNISFVTTSKHSSSMHTHMIAYFQTLPPSVKRLTAQDSKNQLFDSCEVTNHSMHSGRAWEWGYPYNTFYKCFTLCPHAYT